MARIALFGGAFDPPHFGHILTVSHLLNCDLVDQVWLVPTDDGRYDKEPVVRAKHRLVMLERALESEFFGDERVRIEPAQALDQLPGSRTIELLGYVKEQFPEGEYSFVIGADRIPSLDDWSESKRLQLELTFIAVFRPGDPIPESLPPHIEVLPGSDQAAVRVSSSQVRQLIAEGKSVAGIIPRSVNEYIREQGLYR